MSPFNIGLNAGRNGHQRHENPYKNGTEEYKQWDSGWATAYYMEPDYP